MTIHDLLDQTAHVFHQHDAQGDGDGPDLADHQRLNLLIGADITGQHRAGHQAISMGDIGPSQAKDARISGKRPFGKLGQLTIIARRKIIADLPKLLFNKVEVVQQPFGCGHDGLPGLHRLRARPIGPQQDLGIFGYSVT